MDPSVPINAYLRDAWLTAFAWALEDGSVEGIVTKSRADRLVNLAGHDTYRSDIPHDPHSQVTITRDGIDYDN